MVIVWPLMAGWVLFSIGYIVWLHRKGVDEINPYIYDAIPSVFTTLGVLGTFVGIYSGLQNFDVNEIDTSLPTLLGGLKGAFLTSIVGIILSLISNKVSKYFWRVSEKKTPPKATDEVWLLNNINGVLTAIHEYFVGDGDSGISTQLAKLGNKFSDLESQSRTQGTFLEAIQKSLGDEETSLLTQTQKLRSEQNDYSKETTKNIQRIVAAMGESNELVAKLGNKFSELESQGRTQGTFLEAIQKSLGGAGENSLLTQIKKLRSEQNDYSKETTKNIQWIVDAMGESNQLVAQKFDEFSELLRKSTTEGLVEAMKGATEEFNKQMEALISKLVQENFQELNQSVQRMNDWQRENKEMIADLTRQFTKVSDDFETSSGSIANIAQNTEKLTAENSHLSKLIQALQKVMIDDTKYQEIVGKLTATIDTLDKNTTAFDKTTQKLNQWVRNQMNFRDSVAKLLTRLEEIDKIKDINEVFWKDTKRQLEEHVSILKKGSEALAKDVDKINAEFYERLNTTFQNLDDLIERIIQKHDN